MKDEEIINLYWERSEAAIAATAQKYGNYCRSISYNILHNKEDAEECVNDTYLAAWKSIPPHRPNRLAAYLGKIVRNFSLDRFRQYNTEKRGAGQTELVLSELEDCIPAAMNVEQTLEEMALVESIEQFLYSQTDQKRNIFVHRYFFLNSIENIAKLYGMSNNNVASILFRMRKNLKEQLEKEGIIL